LDETLAGCNTAELGKFAQSGEQWQSLRTTLVLSRLQWQVSQAQWSDLRGNYTFGFGYRGCNWSNWAVLIGSILAISLMLGLGNA